MNNKLTAKQIYSKHAEMFHEKIGKLQNYNKIYEKYLSFLPDTGEVLDLACGPGNISVYLKIKKPGLSITGIDFSEEMIAIAKKLLPEDFFIVGNIFDESLYTKKYNGIILDFALPYVRENDFFKLFSLIRAYTKQDGYFFVSFMTGRESGYEKASFSGSDEMFLIYHDIESVKKTCTKSNFFLISEEKVPYHEPDGSITTDVILIFQAGT